MTAIDTQAVTARGDIPSLLRALSAEKLPARAAAARALGQQQHLPAIDPLCRALGQTDDERVLTAITEAMSDLGDGRSIPCLERWSGNRPERLNRAMATAVKIGGGPANSFLEKLASNDKLPRSIREHAEAGGRIVRGETSRHRPDDEHDHDHGGEGDGGEPEDDLIRALSHDDAEVRVSAAATVAQLRRSDAVDGLCSLLERDDAESVEAGLTALTQIESPLAIPCILRWSGDDERRLAIAIEALVMIGGDDSRSTLEILAREHGSPTIRRLATDGLTRPPSPSKRPPRHN